MDNREARAIRITATASKVLKRERKQAERDGVLDGTDLVSMFALTCAMSVARLKAHSPALAQEAAGTALRTLIKNLTVEGIEIPDLDAP